jgi:hypothetical protein
MDTKKAIAAIQRITKVIKPFLRDHLSENAFPSIQIVDHTHIGGNDINVIVHIRDEYLKMYYPVTLLCEYTKSRAKIVGLKFETEYVNRTHFYALMFGSSNLVFNTFTSLLSISVITEHCVRLVDSLTADDENGFIKIDSPLVAGHLWSNGNRTISYTDNRLTFAMKGQTNNEIEFIPCNNYDILNESIGNLRKKIRGWIDA